MRIKNKEILQKFLEESQDIFLDGSERQIPRPGDNDVQKEYYSGKKNGLHFFGKPSGTPSGRMRKKLNIICICPQPPKGAELLSYFVIFLFSGFQSLKQLEST